MAVGFHINETKTKQKSLSITLRQIVLAVVPNSKRYDNEWIVTPFFLVKRSTTSYTCK